MNLADLIDRVERAESGDRELDTAIALLAHPELAEWPRTEHGGWMSPEWGLIAPPEHFTASLDSALGLVERVLPGWGWDIGCEMPVAAPRFYTAEVWSPPPAYFPSSGEHRGKTPALAICAATLRALQDQTDGR